MGKQSLVFLALLFACFTAQAQLPDSKLAAAVRDSIWPKLNAELKNGGFNKPLNIYIRIFKEEHVLEIWAKSGAKYRLFKSYEVCYFSGGLGTKTREGDGKSPEGFYSITASQLNPVSNYHLAINVGYPNQLEKLKGYTGNAIMIHGHCASIGCYAMTDPLIDEIFTLVYQSLQAGQASIALHIFPFRMDDNLMKIHSSLSWYPFWQTMKPAYDYFETYQVPPTVLVVNKMYQIK